MNLTEIKSDEYGVEIDIVYATDRVFTGSPVYKRALCYLHRDAALLLQKAVEIARPLGLKLKIFDAFRPSEAQWVLWNHTPDPDFLADPRRGSAHSRGVAVDLTLIDGKSGQELPMGTPFDFFSALSHHGNLEIPAEAQRNRHLLLGIMSTAGWDFYIKEWWHYQLFKPREYPVLSDSVLAERMM